MLSEPVPAGEVIDHAPVVALPPTLAPLSVTGCGLADWHALMALPGIAVANGLTVISLVSVMGLQGCVLPVPSGSFEVRVKVTIPE